MPVRTTNFSRNTISFQLKATTKSDLKLKQMSPPVDKKLKSDFAPSEKVLKNGHLIPLRERLSMYKLGSPSGDFSPRKVPKKPKRSRKSRKSLNLKLIPAVTLQLPSKYYLSPTSSRAGRRARANNSIMATALEEIRIPQLAEDDIETLVQMFPYPDKISINVTGSARYTD